MQWVVQASRDLAASMKGRIVQSSVSRRKAKIEDRGILRRKSNDWLRWRITSILETKPDSWPAFLEGRFEDGLPGFISLVLNFSFSCLTINLLPIFIDDQEPFLARKKVSQVAPGIGPKHFLCRVIKRHYHLPITSMSQAKIDSISIGWLRQYLRQAI